MHTRLHVLKGMGVPLYVSRRQLPGARDSWRCVQAASTRGSEAAAPGPDNATTADLPIGAMAGAPMPARARAERGALLTELSAEPATAVRTRRPARPDRSSADPVPAPAPFSCQIAALLAGERLWLEELDGVPLAREQVQLIANMVRAMAWPPGPPKVQQFDWPFHDNPQLDQGRDAARSALHAFVLRQVDSGARAVVALGQPATELLAGIEMSQPIVAIPTSRALLTEPALKRDVWHRFRGLGGR